jgi:starch-binding outer membrane protein, SusD/RagB family
MKFNMKKRYIKIVCLLCVIFSISCSEDFLDRKPKDVISDDAVYTSEIGVRALTVGLYERMPTEDFDFTATTDGTYLSTITDEAVWDYPWLGEAVDGPVLDSWCAWWTDPDLKKVVGYEAVRAVNDFIEKIPAASISDELKARFKAEARFVRAYYYFSLAKRYGGVPLITTVQNFTGSNLAELQVARNTEKDIYDFVSKECDEAAAVLPANYEATDQNRATKYAALALKSRAMLYAASIAKYGTLDLNSLVGLPFSEADAYWKKAYDASKSIIDSKAFALYAKNPDKVLNFQELFLKGTGNPEVIMAKAYLAPDYGHSFDFMNAPQSFKVDYGCATNPTLELVEEFEYKDGSKGTLKIKDPVTGLPIEYAHPTDLFKDKDPRCLASIITPFAPWQGGVVEIRAGIIDGGKVVTGVTAYGIGENEIDLVGKDGPGSDNDPTKSGFYIKKFMDPVNRVEGGKSSTPWYIFRYAEVLLNFAEAAIELGKNEDALWAVNEIRNRAGIAPLTSITRDQVRHERKVELAFESHRYWDIRRWRIATELLSNTQFHALYPYLIWENGKKPSEMKYTFDISTAKYPRTFPQKLYYEKIDTKSIAKNPNLIQNLGY